MLQAEYLGYIAGLITTFALFPQAFRILSTRQTRDISLAWAVAMNTGITMWLLYGIAISDPPMIAANSVSLVLLLVILACKLRWK